MRKTFILPILCCSLIAVSPVSAAEQAESQTEYEMTEETESYDEENPYVYYDPADGGEGPEYIDGLNPEDLSRQPSDGCGYITFAAVLPESVNDVDKVTMECFEMDTYKDYKFNLYHINDFTTHAQLPYGTYYIYAGGFVGDAISKYPIEKMTFTVGESNPVITFHIGETETESEEPVQEIQAEITTETVTEPVTEEQTETKEQQIKPEQKKKIPVAGIIAVIATPFIFTSIVYKLWKKREQNDE